MQIIGESQGFCDVTYLLVDLRLWSFLEAQREGHVFCNVHVRVEGVILKHHRQIAILGLQMADRFASDVNLAFADVFEPGNHAQGG